MKILTSFLIIIYGLFYFAMNTTYATQSVTEDTCKVSIEPFTMTFGPFLQQPSDTSMTMVWLVNRLAIPYVWFGINATNEKSVYNSQHGLVNGCEQLCKVTLSDLDPGTTYQYQAVSKELVVSGNGRDDVAFYDDLRTYKSRSCTFKTFAQDSSCSFVILNDLAGHIDLMDSLLSIINVDSLDFIVFNGNMLNAVENVDQIGNEFLEPCVRLFATKIPFIFVRGNQECRGAMAHHFSDYVGSRDGNHYFSFNHGSTHFIILDSGGEKEDSHTDYLGLADFQNYRNEQTVWLENDIQSENFKSAEFRIVLSHLPFYGGDNGFGEQDIRSKWGSIINQANIDLMLCGHSDEYRRIHSDSQQNNYPILIGSGSALGAATVMKVDVNKDRIKVTVIRGDGTVLDQYSLEGLSDVPSTTRSIPCRFSLMQNYPNPFNPLTYIKYSIPRTDWVTLKLYNILGKEIKTLIHCTQPAGDYTIQFDASNLPNGVYMYKLETGQYSAIKKLTLLK